ncbi:MULTISPECIES: hypothetical protein [unclassified Phyllobacterium]|uniref:hypothetical protein n=1 Tax=unclassified Phyllobacterium TaxID=2638441 RepID=UPI003012B519
MQIFTMNDEVRSQVSAFLSGQMAEILDERTVDLTCEGSIKGALASANFGEYIVDRLWQAARDRADWLNAELVL